MLHRMLIGLQFLDDGEQCDRFMTKPLLDRHQKSGGLEVALARVRENICGRWGADRS
jgi:hypothetical protein